jgi:uncharacterized protein (TIGR02598 family)
MNLPNLRIHRPYVVAFSLPEVAMSIGIIAVAFVALFSLLPAGLNTYRASITEANQTWIVQGMNSMVQTTDFAQLDQLDFESSGEIYYFDEEGRLIDRKSESNTDARVVMARLYAVKLFVDDHAWPNTDDDDMAHTRRVHVVMAQVSNATAMEKFDALASAASLENLKPNSPVRLRSFVVSRMDAQPVANLGSGN